MTVANLFVKIALDIGGFQQQMALASQGVEGFVQSADGTVGSLRAVGVAATAAGAAIVAALGFAIKVAAEAERVNKRLEQALRSAGEGGKAEAAELAALATQLQSTSRFSDEAIKSNAALLLSMGATKNEVQTLLPGIVDLSVALGIDLKSATQAVGKALNGNMAILQRYGVQVGENIPASERLAALQRALGQRAGAAAADVNTFGGALARLKNRIDDLLEVLGGPFLAPLTRLANVLGVAAEAVTKFLAANQLLAKALGFVAAALAGLLLGAGGLLIFFGILTKILALLNSMIAATGTLAGAFRAAAVAVRLFASATVVLAILGAIITVIGILVDRLGGLEIAMKTIGRFFQVFFREVGEGFRLLMEGIKEFNLDKVQQALDRLKFPQRVAAAEAAALNRELKATRAAGEQAAGGLKKTSLEIEDIKEKADAARRAVEVFNAELDAAAAASARRTLETPGLNEQRVTATLARLESARLRNAEEAARRRVQVEEETLAEIRKNIAESNGATTKDLQEQEERLAKARQALENARLATVQRNAERIAAAEKALADERLAVEQELADSRLEVVQKGIQTEAALVKLRLEAERDAAARVLELTKREEDFRLATLRSVADLELALQQTILTARVSLIEANMKREEAALRRRAAERARLVKEGFLTEQEAEAEATRDRIAFIQKRTQAEFQAEQARLRAIQQAATISLGIAASEFLAKQRILVAENNARKAQLSAEFALKKADLAASEAVLRAETQAKIDALQRQLQARLDALSAEQQAREAVGDITPEERAAFQRRIALIKQQFTSQTRDLAEIVSVEQRKANAEFEAAQRIHDQAILDLDESTKQQLAANAEQFQATQKSIEAKRLQDSAGVAARLADIEGKLVDDVEEARDKLRAEGLTDAEIQQRLLPATTLLNNIKRFTTDLTRETDAQLNALEKFYNDMLARLTPKLQAVLDLVNKLANPAALQQALDNVRPLFVPPIGAPAPAAAGAAAVPAGGALFQFNGVTFTLTADETSLLQRILLRLVGPEGRRFVEDALRRQPHP